MSGQLHGQLVDYCRRIGVTGRAVVEAVMHQDVMDGRIVIPREPSARDAWILAYADGRIERNEHLSSADERAEIRESRLADLRPRPAPRVSIPISRELGEDIAAQLERRAARGEIVDADELFDAAINRMLDQIETVPASSICGICTRQLDSKARLLPVGVNDALVWVCWNCDSEHPRKGRYAFGGGRSVDRLSMSHVSVGGRDGNGNRQRGNRSGGR